MAGKNNPANSPTRKRPRLPPDTASRPNISRHRPPPGRPVVNNVQTADAQPGTNMRSFADLIGNGRSRADQALGEDAPDDAWATIANTLDNLASASAFPSTFNDESKSRLLYEPDPTDMPDTVNLSDAARELTFDRLVLDLTLKTKIQISSPYSLQWALTRPQGEEYAALLRLLTSNTLTDEGSVPAQSVKNSLNTLPANNFSLRHPPSAEQVEIAKQQLYEALYYFRCPSAPLASKVAVDWQALTTNYGKTSRQLLPGNDSQMVAVTRLLEWQSSLQSLFFAYRHGHAHTFYVILSTTVVIFSHTTSKPKEDRGRHPDIDAAGPEAQPWSLRAALAKASLGLRALMKEHEVPFRIVEGTDGFEEPCVIVEGDVSVHALYNFVSIVGHKISNATDVPILLSDKPFRGCTIASSEVFHARNALVPGKDGQKAHERYTLQMRGLFTPRQVEAICNTLAVIQNRHFEARLEAESKGSMLNACGHDGGDDKYKLRGPVVLSRIRVSPDVEGFSVSTRDA